MLRCQPLLSPIITLFENRATESVLKIKIDESQ